MSKPPSLPLWATDLNYPVDAAPESGTATKVPLSTGQATIGWRPDQVPTAQELNTQMNLVGQWVAYLEADSKTIFPRPNMATNWAAAGTPATEFGAYLASSGAGSAFFCLSDHMRDGMKLSTVRLWMAGDDAVDVVATIHIQDFVAHTVNSTHTATLSNVSSVPMDHVDITAIAAVSGQLTSHIWLEIAANAAGAKVFMIVLAFS